MLAMMEVAAKGDRQELSTRDLIYIGQTQVIAPLFTDATCQGPNLSTVPGTSPQAAHLLREDYSESFF